jgi:hypothetical protein
MEKTEYCYGCPRCSSISDLDYLLRKVITQIKIDLENGDTDYLVKLLESTSVTALESYLEGDDA